MANGGFVSLLQRHSAALTDATSPSSSSSAKRELIAAHDDNRSLRAQVQVLKKKVVSQQQLVKKRSTQMQASACCVDCDCCTLPSSLFMLLAGWSTLSFRTLILGVAAGVEVHHGAGNQAIATGQQRRRESSAPQHQQFGHGRLAGCWGCRHSGWMWLRPDSGAGAVVSRV